MAHTYAKDSTDAYMQEKLNEARVHINDGQYSRAVASIQAAANACGCGSGELHLNKRACNISQGVKAILSSDNEALEKLSARPCSCGFVWPRCTRPLHNEIIHELSVCLEQAERLTASFSVAIGLIRLDPGSPIGYCRAARLARRLWSNSPDSPPAVARERSAVAKDSGLPAGQPLGDITKRIVRKGLVLVVKRRDYVRTKYHIILNKMGDAMKLAEAKRDPLQEFPKELISQIFSYLDTTTRCRAMCVSRSWANLLAHDGALWKEVMLGHPGNPGRYMIDFLRKRQHHIRTFSVDEVRELALTPSKVRTLLALPNLQRLRLSTSRLPLSQGFAQGMLGDMQGRTKLTHIRVFGMSWVLVKEMVNCNLQTLQVVDITDQILPQWNDFNSLGNLPQLRKLRLVGSKTSAGGVTMDRIRHICPQLEHLYIDGIEVEPLHEPAQGWCSSLRSIVLGPHTRLRPSVFVPFLVDCQKLESVELLVPGLTAYCASLFAVGSLNLDGLSSVFEAEYAYERLNFTRLKVFRCRSALHPELLQAILAPAIASGTLEALELSMGHSVSSPHLTVNPNIPNPIVPVQDLAFTFSEKVHTLGLHDFNWAPATNSTAFEGGPFIDWLKNFPGVHTVTVYPGAYSSLAMCSIIGALLEMAQVKVIYQELLTGVDWDEGNKRAKAKGMRIYHQKGLVPPKWESFD